MTDKQQPQTPAEPSEANMEVQNRRTSSRKVEANRRNARRSTGPKTKIGKNRVAKNALKDGFFSKWLIVQHANGKESQAEYDDWYAGIRGHYQPVGFLEEFLVEKLAVWSWRLRRLIRCESGQIARALADYQQDLDDSGVKSAEQSGVAPVSSLEAITEHLWLPSKEEVERLLRYEAMIEKQVNHAIAELERLQRRRNGESVAAPISIAVSGQ